MKKWLFIPAALACLLLAFTASNNVTYAILDSAPQENAQRVYKTVEVVCDYARSLPDDGGSEEACGRAQDASGTIYTCSPADVCTVTERGGQ